MRQLPVRSKRIYFQAHQLSRFIPTDLLGYSLKPNTWSKDQQPVYDFETSIGYKINGFGQPDFIVQGIQGGPARMAQLGTDDSILKNKLNL